MIEKTYVRFECSVLLDKELWDEGDEACEIEIEKYLANTPIILRSILSFELKEVNR